MRVCVVEDQALLLKSLCELLASTEGVELAGSHLSAEAALEKTDWTKVDVLLSDIDLPGLSGVELIRRVKVQWPAVNCMAWTVYEDRSTVFAAIKAGACGYLLKGSAPEDVLLALRDLVAGGAPMSPRVARKLLVEFQRTPEDQRPAADVTEPLTSRELEVLKGIEQGLSYKEIAQALSLSTHTVHGHLKHIYEKFQAHGRRDAIATARRLGVL
jgi:two-component system NarL family response regulator